MTPTLWAVLIITVLALAGILALAAQQRRKELNGRPHGESLSSAEAQALAAGIRDVYQGWITWAAETPERDLQGYEEWAEAVAHKAREGYWAPSPMSGSDDDQLDTVLEQQPRYTWGLDDLRQYMAELRHHQQRKGQHVFMRASKISSRLTEAAAIITDLRDDSYNPGRAPTTGTWAFHKAPSVRATYLAGRGTGTETIMDAITNARIMAREVDAATESIAAANERHAAALRALRETGPSVSARDQHADFDRQLHTDTPRTDTP